MRTSDRYPDYEELTGYTLTDDQIATILRLKALRARRGELTHRAFVHELLEFLSHAEGTFRFEELETDKSTARFGTQVAHIDGHGLLQPTPETLEARADEIEQAHEAGDVSRAKAERYRDAYEGALADDPEAYEDLIEDVLEVARALAHGGLDRDAGYDRLLARLGRDPTVWHADGAGNDGRVNFSNQVTHTAGLGLFRPDPEEMGVPEPESAYDDPALEVTRAGEAGTLAIDATLPEGGYVALMTPAGQLVAATEYVEAGASTIEYPLSGLDAFDLESVVIVLFKGEADDEFDLSNVPYTAGGAPLRADVSLQASPEEEGEVAQ